MQITFLGTAAATSYPLAFCKCENCEEARRTGGKNLRKRSSLLVNEDLLIDLGPDVLTASFLSNKPLANLRYWLQTHPHSDHFDPAHLTTRVPEYMSVNQAPLNLYASQATLNRMSRMLKAEGDISGLLDPQDQQKLNLQVFALEKYKPYNIGPYEVWAFAANHDSSCDALLYAVTQDNFSVFYGSDTDTLSEETWQGLKEADLRFDLVVLDHTYGPQTIGGGHLNADKFIDTLKRMKAENLLAGRARFLATHISHEGNPPHEVLSAFAAQHGYEIAYDGLVI